MKHGLRTTEFWVTVLTDLGLLAAALADALPARWAAVAAAVSTVGYSLARGLAKVTVPPTAPFTYTTTGTGRGARIRQIQPSSTSTIGGYNSPEEG